jgi:MFS family permease
MNAAASLWSRLRARPPADKDQIRKRAFAILFVVSVTTAVGNNGMQSVLPAIGRQIGIPDPMVTAIYSLSALLWALSSPFWARASDRRGRKPLILVGLGGFVVSMVACGAVVSAGARHLAPPVIIFVFFLLARALFGLFGSASNPASQAYVADQTTRDQRTQSMSTLAGAFGLGTIFGPLAAAMFVLPVVGLAGPMFAFAIIAGLVMLAVARWLPESRPRAPETEPLADRAAPVGGVQRAPLSRSLWVDRRLRPFLIYGFLASTCQTALIQMLGFLIIDKVHLSPLGALDYIKMAMMTGAVAGLLGQWGLIRMFRMSPRDLLRWGAGLGCAGSLIMAFAPDYWTLVIAYTVSSLGFSFTRPGFTAGASLAVTQTEQAGAAGAIAAVNGLNVILAPLFLLLYEQIHAAPFLVSAALLAGLMVYTFANAALRNASEGATSEDEATESLLEKSDEGAV